MTPAKEPMKPSDRKKPYCTDITWEGRADCKHCAIRQRVLFSEVSNEDLDEVLHTIDHLCYPAHAALYQLGETGKSIFTIRSGLVKLIQYLPNGNQRIVRLLKPGSVAGLELVVGQDYRHTAIALENTKVCRIPMAAIEHLGIDHPQLSHQMALRWQQSVDDAERFITELSTGTAESRVAHLLLLLQSESSKGNCRAISREDMGAMLGITTETASRVMADFKRRGITQDISAHHCQCDTTKLHQIISEQ
jgi:CRP-like cAMP-binding protein